MDSRFNTQGLWVVVYGTRVHSGCIWGAGWRDLARRCRRGGQRVWDGGRAAEVRDAWLWGLGFRAWGVGCGVQGLRFRVQGFDSRVSGFGFTRAVVACEARPLLDGVWELGFRVWGLGVEVGFSGFGLRVVGTRWMENVTACNEKRHGLHIQASLRRPGSRSPRRQSGCSLRGTPTARGIRVQGLGFWGWIFGLRVSGCDTPNARWGGRLQVSGVTGVWISWLRNFVSPLFVFSPLLTF